MVKAVLFDLGNTLVYSHPEETFQRILKEHGIVKPIDEVRQAMAEGNKEFDIDKHTGLTAHEFYVQWNLVELKHLGIRGSRASRLAEEIETTWFQYGKFYLYRDVRKTMRKLKQMGFKLGIITGGYTEDIEQILPSVGMETFFDVCVGVNTTGKRKPHPKAFEHALRQLNIKPQEAVFVGDNFEADYLGAKNAGMIPVLIKRENTQVLSRLWANAAPSDVRTIKRLDEIFKVLDEISP